MNREPLVSGRHVTKVWPGTTGLHAIDFELARGELVAVVGRSGSGKSTLISLLAGWCQPSTGVIRRAPDALPSTWSGTAVVPQTFGLIPELTVAENVSLPSRVAGIASHIGDVLLSFDIDELGARLPHEISLGERQRVAVARSVATPAALILVDEPTSHQDHAHATAVMQELRTRADHGSAVVVASHDPAVVSAADRTIDLDGPLRSADP